MLRVWMVGGKEDGQCVMVIHWFGLKSGFNRNASAQVTQNTILVTGGYGCIGAETAKWLVKHSDADVLVCSRTVRSERNERVFHDTDRSRLRFIQADVRDADRLVEILGQESVTHVVHLAALQTPDCNAHRDLGLQINLAGTQNVIEAIKECDSKVERFLFASSIAVYGPRESYPGDRVAMLAEPRPVNVYGAWKLAGEQLTRILHEETGIPTISLRPGVLFGPGRDAGLTSTPTTAMKHVALGMPYQIPFRSRQDYLFAPDVGAAFGTAVLSDFDETGVFTLPSHTVDTTAFVDGIRRAASELGLDAAEQLSVGDQEVPFICDLDYQPFLDAFPQAPHTDLASAIERSLQVFVDQVGRGWLSRDNL